MTIRPPGRTIFDETSETAMHVSVVVPAAAGDDGSIGDHGDGEMKIAWL
jgi:hypothetical protein